MKRIVIAAAMAASLAGTQLFAADNTGTSGALAPGKPAGVKKAQDADMTTWYIIGGVAAAGLIIGLTAGQGSGVAITPVTAAATTST